MQAIESGVAGAGVDREHQSESGSGSNCLVLTGTPGSGSASSVDDASATTQAVPSQPPRRRGWLVLVGGLALALPFALAAVFFWKTRDGVVRIESDDKTIQIAFDKDELKVVGAYNEPLAITPGQHGLRIKKGKDFEFDTDKLIVNHGETVVLKVEFVPGEVRIVQEGKGVLDSKSLGEQVDNTDTHEPKFLYPVPWLDEQQGMKSHLWQTEISSDGKLFFAAGDTGPAGASVYVKRPRASKLKCSFPAASRGFFPPNSFRAANSLSLVTI